MKKFRIHAIPKNMTLADQIAAAIKQHFPSATVEVLEQTNATKRIISVTMTETEGNYNALFASIRGMGTVKTITVYNVHEISRRPMIT
ncbi:hypothetical protein HYW55_01155 [Candidatus Gottesmanbacteria bacterium]|nr:hypothetical protein [Candidatus Gottesmanbacteria bacterium]